jgi:hypothetical protein
MSSLCASASVNQTVFVERVLPAVEKHARFAFRSLPRGAREEMVAECVAVAWASFVRLVKRGKDPATFASALGTYAVRHVKSGRYVDGIESSKDVLSPRARKRRGFKVERLTRHNTVEGTEWQEAVTEPTRTPPPDAAAFRIDFPRWLESLGERNRRIADDLMLGNRGDQTARKFGISPGRIAQLRAEYYRLWQRFHGESA